MLFQRNPPKPPRMRKTAAPGTVEESAQVTELKAALMTEQNVPSDEAETLAYEILRQRREKGL